MRATAKLSQNFILHGHDNTFLTLTQVKIIFLTKKTCIFLNRDGLLYTLQLRATALADKACRSTFVTGALCYFAFAC